MPISRQLSGGPLLAALVVWLLPACADPIQPTELADAGQESQPVQFTARTRLALDGQRFRLNGALTYHGEPPEGMLLNVRMVNSVFEDDGRPDFDPEKNTAEFVGRMPDYVAQGVRAFTVSLQGGYPGYSGARNSAFRSDGTLDATYLARVARVIERADGLGAVIILSLFYQRQDQILRNEEAVRAGVIKACGLGEAEGIPQHHPRDRERIRSSGVRSCRAALGCGSGRPDTPGPAAALVAPGLRQHPGHRANDFAGGRGLGRDSGSLQPALHSRRSNPGFATFAPPTGTSRSSATRTVARAPRQSRR